MNYYNFDINVYNSFIYYSGGYTPTYQQYQHFANNIYNYQMTPMVPMTPMTPMAQGPLQNYITNQTLEQPPTQKFSFCIKGMKCKDIKCNDYHHPSKDLDILNASKKNNLF